MVTPLVYREARCQRWFSVHKYVRGELTITELSCNLGEVDLIWQGGGVDEDIEGGLWKCLDTRKGGSEKISGSSENLYASKPTGGGGGS